MKDQILVQYKNIAGLLEHGSFPGQYAPAVVAAFQFVTTIISDVEKDIQSEQGKAAGSSDRDEKVGSGLVGSDVPNRRKQSPRKNCK